MYSNIARKRLTCFSIFDFSCSARLWTVCSWLFRGLISYHHTEFRLLYISTRLNSKVFW
ncbi:hypothetical protein Plhal304r1_c034g0106201 [Plasmopara halstedii]